MDATRFRRAAAAVRAFVIALSWPRDYESETCMVCDRPAGKVCDIEAHADAEASRGVVQARCGTCHSLIAGIPADLDAHRRSCAAAARR